MHILLFIIAAVVISGCAGIAVNAPPPSIDDFPQQELAFRVSGPTDAVLRKIQDYLVQRGLPSIVTVRAPKTFVVTTYIEEPRTAEDRRVRRTAFRLGVSQQSLVGASPCTTVAVVALTKSRGVREEIWSIQDSDTKFVSSVWPDVKALLEKGPCL